MKDNALKPSKCVNCGKEFDAAMATDENSRPPKNGDVALCFGCGYPMEFLVEEDGTTLVEMSPEKLAEVLSDPEVIRIRMIQEAFIKSRRLFDQ